MATTTDSAIATGMSRERVMDRARAVIPNGMSSGGRGEPEEAMVRASGAYLWNVEGKRFVDHLNAWGAMVIGHADDRVNDAAARAAAYTDLTWVGPQQGEIELAETIVDLVPSAERVAFFPTGTESLLHAVHVARFATGRRKLVMIHGSFNGWVDPLAVGSRFGYGDSAAAPRELNSAGLDPASADQAIVIDWNDAAAARDVFAHHGDEIAALVTEPYIHTFGCVPPEPGYLETLRELCDQSGALLVYDEVKTGFRADLGGYQAIAGVLPDLSAFGKAIANGWTLAALAGRARYMDLLGEGGPDSVDTNGTMNAQPYALAAGRATVEILADGGIERLHQLGERMRSGLRQVIAASRVEACVTGLGSEWTVYFRSEPPRNYREAAHDHDHETGEAYLAEMWREGVLEPPLVIGDRRLTLAHTEADVDYAVEAAAQALARIA